MAPAHQFQFSQNAEHDFEMLEKPLQKRILAKLAFWEKTTHPLAHAKKLQAAENRYRFRIGDYRIIVAKKDGGELIVLVILKIGHRREVYREAQ